MSEAIGADFAAGEFIFMMDPELSIEHLEALEELLGIDPECLDFLDGA